MIRALSRTLVRTCAALLPRERAEWARAMASEAEHIKDDKVAFAFAAGCLRASLSACYSAAPISARLARIGVAAVTVVYALFHLQFALNGMETFLGSPDPHYERLLRKGAYAAERYRNLQPYAVAMMAGIGLTHLTAAVFLVAWVPRLFAGSLVVAGFMIGVFAAGAVARFGAISWPFQILPLLLLGGAGFALALLRPTGQNP